MIVPPRTKLHVPWVQSLVKLAVSTNTDNMPLTNYKWVGKLGCLQPQHSIWV